MQIFNNEFDPEHAFEVLGLIVTVIMAVFAYFRSQQDLRTNHALLITYLGAVFTLLLSIRYGLIPQSKSETRNAAEIAMNLASRPQIVALVEEAARGSESAEKVEVILMKEWFKRRLDQIKSEVSQFGNGEFNVTTDQMKVFAEMMINNAQESLTATSKVSKERWWDKDFGRRYLKLNIDRAKHIEIKRIFIFDSDNSFQMSAEILRQQAIGGIKVKYIVASADQWRKLRCDKVVIDARIAGKLELDGDDEGLSTFFTDRQRIDEIKRDIEELEANATTYSLASSVEARDKLN